MDHDGQSSLQGIGLRVKSLGGLICQAQQLLELQQKRHLFGALATIGIAHTHGHLVGQLALPVVGEGLRRTGQGEALEQHVLVKA
jgi:hypothetical protein